MQPYHGEAALSLDITMNRGCLRSRLTEEGSFLQTVPNASFVAHPDCLDARFPDGTA